MYDNPKYFFITLPLTCNQTIFLYNSENMKDTITALKEILKTFPTHWDGKEAILEMRDANYNQWRQNEWIGFYFQYLCDKNLPQAGMQIPGTKFGRAKFDGNMLIDWDFKAHPIHNKSGQRTTKLITNDLEATVDTVAQNSTTGLIVAMGEATFDDPVTMPFRAWHKDLKGGDSTYALQNIARGASKRLYKTQFQVESINFYLLSQRDLEQQGRFQEGMRNSNGNPRRPKLIIDLATISPVDEIRF